MRGPGRAARLAAPEYTGAAAAAVDNDSTEGDDMSILRAPLGRLALLLAIAAGAHAAGAPPGPERFF